MSVEDELSMGEAGTPAEDQGVDDTELSLSDAEMSEVLAKRDLDQASKDFDLKAWIDGVRSARAFIRLYARQDLNHHVKKAAQEMFEAMQVGDNLKKKALEKKIIELKKQYLAASIDIVIEERSKDWQARKTAELKQAGVEGAKALTLGLVAAQIVEPKDGFTGEDLAGLAEVIPSQINDLVREWGELSGQSDSKGLPTF